MHEPKVAIMATGGIDSTVLMYSLYERGLKPTIITIDYGHSAFPKQVENLNLHIEELELPPLVVIPIKYPEWQCKPGLFKKDYVPQENAPLEDWNELRYADTFIEGRNLIMVSYALAFCSANKIDELLAGYLYGEEEWQKRRTYKLMTGDNSPQFVDMMNLLTGVGFSHQVRFRAPFYEDRLSKKDVIDIGENFDIDFSKTYSCYFNTPCGVCDNCLLRAKYLGEENQKKDA